MTRVGRVVLALTLICAGCAPAATSAPSTGGSAAPSGSSDDAAARTYCTDKGGMLVERVAVSNTNADPSAQLQLAGAMTFCEFESGTGDQTTRISVDLVTLSSDRPSLAAVAYLSKVPPTQTHTPSTNPGAFYCTDTLGGARALGNISLSGRCIG